MTMLFVLSRDSEVKCHESFNHVMLRCGCCIILFWMKRMMSELVPTLVKVN